MIIKYFNTLLKKVKRYDKKATNPFLSNNYEYNPFKSIYEQTYIWTDSGGEQDIDPAP